MPEILIGFDVREMWIPTDTLWSQDRREQYLLVSEIEKPLSIDLTVWQSAFDIDTLSVSGTSLRIENIDPKPEFQTKEWQTIFANCQQLETPQWVGARQAWDNLERLIQWVDKSWTVWKPSSIIAITCAMPHDEVEEAENYNILPKSLNPEWQLLGYDVADYFFTSFLMNAGYLEDEKPELISNFARSLNDKHLFETLEQAEEYVPVAESRDRGHGKMYAYGIYLIEDRTILLDK